MRGSSLTLARAQGTLRVIMRVRSGRFLSGVFLLVVGCSGQSRENGGPKSNAEVAREEAPIPQSSDNLDESIAHALKSMQLEAISIQPMAQGPEPAMIGDGPEAKYTWKSADGIGGLLESKGKKENIIFAGNRCMLGGGCSCEREMAYSFGKAANGHIVVLVPNPNVHEQIVMRPGSCGTGCGQPSPPLPPVYFELPVNAIGLVEFASVPFEVNKVVVTCEHPLPRP